MQSLMATLSRLSISPGVQVAVKNTCSVVRKPVGRPVEREISVSHTFRGWPFTPLKSQQMWDSNTLQHEGLEGCQGRRGNHVVAARRGMFEELKSIREDKSGAAPVSFESPLSILLYPDPKLRAENKKIFFFDEKLQQLVTEMFDLMYETEGVGLAAPQVGVNVRLMVYNPVGVRGKGTEYVLVNPSIVRYTKAKEVDAEGCLSFPSKDGQGLFDGEVERSIGVKVDAQDIKGRKFSMNLKDWQARIFQHEYDHLEGTLFHDRMSIEVLQTVREDLEALEAEYTKRTGLPSPERVARRFEKLSA